MIGGYEDKQWVDVASLEAEGCRGPSPAAKYRLYKLELLRYVRINGAVDYSVCLMWLVVNA